MNSTIDQTLSDGEALVVLDDQLRARAANQAFYRTFRLAPEETIGVRIDELGGRKWGARLTNLLGNVLHGRSETEHFELIADSEDPARALFWLSASLVPSDAGDRTILLAFENVSAKKQDGDVLAERTQELEEFARFAGRTAHTFNNILTVIGMTSDMLRSDAGEGTPQAADLDEINVATKRAAELTRELLNSSRRTLPQPTGLDSVRVGRSGAELAAALDGVEHQSSGEPEKRYGRLQLSPPDGSTDQMGSQTILLVDDEPALLSLARRVLAEDGYRILVAEDGAVALRIAAGEVGEIDLVV
nr:PAS domain-containing protein [Verrucomicrobiota bacterium]